MWKYAVKYSRKLNIGLFVEVELQLEVDLSKAFSGPIARPIIRNQGDRKMIFGKYSLLKYYS